MLKRYESLNTKSRCFEQKMVEKRKRQWKLRLNNTQKLAASTFIKFTNISTIASAFELLHRKKNSLSLRICHLPEK